MTRYVEAFSWTNSVGQFLKEQIRERPLLNVCSGRAQWGDVTLPDPVTMDRHEIADVRGDWLTLPFRDDAFAAVFADPPWNAAYKADVATFMREALRVAPVAYLMAPWIYGAAWAELTACWCRQMPGVNQAVVLTRYQRRAT